MAALALIAVDGPSRMVPEAESVVAGVFAGGLRSAGRLAVGGVDLPKGWAPSMGARLGYFPRRYFGLEIESAGLLSKASRGAPTWLWDTRGSLVGRLGLRNVSPFVLLGGGAIGRTTGDADPSFHVGGGLEANISKRGQVRVDVRDVMAASTDDHSESHNLVVTLGVAFVFRDLARFNPAS